jgi:hypothetical protein
MFEGGRDAVLSDIGLLIFRDRAVETVCDIGFLIIHHAVTSVPS